MLQHNKIITFQIKSDGDKLYIETYNFVVDDFLFEIVLGPIILFEALIF
jgi:hypothetical protein